MDRKTIITLLVVTATFLFFSSDAWHKIVRKVFGLPDPPKVTEMAKDSVVAGSKEVKRDTTTPKMGETPAPAGVQTSIVAKPDSLTQAQSDSIAKLAARRVTVKTPDYVAVVGAKGGRIEALQLRKVTNREGQHPWILPENRGGALTVKVGDDDLSNELFAIEGMTGDTLELKGTDSVTLSLTWQKGGKAFERRYTFRAGSSSVGLAFANAGWDTPAYKLMWEAGLLQIDPQGPKIPFGPPHFNNLEWKDNEAVTSQGEGTPISASGPLSWVGVRSQYAMAAVIFSGEARDGELVADSVSHVDGADEKSFKWSFRWRPQPGPERMELAVTPLEVNALKSWNVGFEQMLFSGYAWFLRADIWFPQLCLFVLGMLQFFYKVLPNYGVAIILLTLVARAAVLPLTLKQVKQSKRMSEVMPLLKPKLDALKEKHKGDARKVQEETMKLYSEYGINPLATMAGCLPMLLQMPVFIALYMVLGRAIELRSQPFFGWITDLSRSDVVLEAVKIPFVFPQGLAVLPIFMAASLYGLNKLTIKDPQQQAMVWIMPIMMLVFSGSMPSGLVLYLTVSNVFSMAQTWLINAGPLPTALASKATPAGGVEVKADRSKKKKA
ncbi:MAG: YidC/Oxa1 family insertase periplasmic-domain containing protein [Fibrobacterota bacterium]